jgi:hypothetical protein
LNEMVTTGNCPWWLIVRGDEVVVKLLIAESGTGAARDEDELEDEPDPEEPEVPWVPELWLDEERAVVGVEEERLVELELAAPRVALLEETIVEFPVVPDVLLVRVLTGEEELRPAFDEGLSVLTEPFEAEDVRPDVLCALEPELLEPWI